MDLPKISVITITYGHENYILETIKGVLSQNYEGKIEFIIANDNSPDNTDSVVNNYLNEIKLPKNIKIKYIQHKENKGMMPNFFWALDQAKGKYIALCEGDDYWTDPLKLQKQVDFLEENEDYNICFHKVYNRFLTEKALSVDKVIEERFEKIQKKEKINYQDLLIYGNFIHTCSVLFRRTLNEFPIEFQFSPAGDYLLHILNSQNGYIHRIEEYMAVYRRDSGIFSTLSTEKFIVARLNYLTAIFSMLEKGEDKKIIFDFIQKEYQNLISYKRPEKEKGIKETCQILLNKIIAKIK